MGNALNASVEINNYAPVIFDELVENNMRFKADDHMGATLSPIVWQMKELTKIAYSQHPEIANDIAQPLDYLLDFCYNDECHKLFEGILGSIESKYPEMIAFYKSGYVDMWSDEQPEITEVQDD